MRGKLVVGISMALLIAVGSFAEGKKDAAPKEEAKAMILTLGHSGSPTHHYQVYSLKFAELVGQRTNGKIKINVFPSDQLGPGPEQLESVKVGTQDMAIEPDAFMANHEKLFNALGMPYNFTSFEQVKKIPGSDAAKFLEKKAEEKGFVILGWMANGFRLTTSNKVIAKPEDIKGLKIRIGSAKLIADLLTTLGANPTPVAMSETYTALQTKTVDGQENPTTNILSNKLFEVQKNVSLTRHQYVAQPLFMNKAKFDKLSPEFQKILKDTGREIAEQDVQTVQNDEAKQLEELKAKGMIVTQPDTAAFKAALAPLYTKYAQANGEEWAKLMKMIEEIK